MHFPSDKFSIRHCVRRLRLPRRNGAAREKPGRVAPNEVTTRAAGGRHGAADSFDFIEAQHHETALYVGPRGERVPRRGTFQRRRLSSLPTPFGRAGRPRRAFSRIIRRCDTIVASVNVRISTWSCYHTDDHEEKKERERKNDTTPTEGASMGRRCQTRRHLIIESMSSSFEKFCWKSPPGDINFFFKSNRAYLYPLFIYTCVACRIFIREDSNCTMVRFKLDENSLAHSTDRDRRQVSARTA